MKATLQQKIIAGDIRSMTQLLDFVSGQGWKVTRNGVDYLGLQDAAGKRFRVQFPFPNDTRSDRPKVPRDRSASVRRELPPGYWIYGLFAHHGTEHACYIGQAVDYLQRIKHHIRGREGRSSWDLFRWAETRGVVVGFALLDFIPGAPRTGNLASEATMLEGLWLHRAQAANYLTPGIERWGGLPRPIANSATQWPADEVAAVIRPIGEVLYRQLLPSDIGIEPVRVEYEAAITSEI